MVHNAQKQFVLLLLLILNQRSIKCLIVRLKYLPETEQFLYCLVYNKKVMLGYFILTNKLTSGWVGWPTTPLHPTLHHKTIKALLGNPGS
jgi:hypothetical protein